MSTKVKDKFANYVEKFIELFDETHTFAIAMMDNVSSHQLSLVRYFLRGKAVIMMGKNSSTRFAFKKLSNKYPELEQLIPKMKNNLGVIFCKSDLTEIREIIINNRVNVAPKAGAVLSTDIVILPKVTGLDPSHSSSFRALNIPVKINRGLIEVTEKFTLVKAGDAVTESQSIILKKIGILPCSNGIEMLYIYDNGSIYDASVLEITRDDILSSFKSAIEYVKAISYEIALPNKTTIPYVINDAFKHCVALVLDTDFTFKEMENIKEIIQNPEAYSRSVANQSNVNQSNQGGNKKEEVVEEEEEEDDDEVMFNLFD